MSPGDVEKRAGRGIPSLAETIILIQAIANGVLVYWAFKEYLNNQYLQSYVDGFVAANTPALQITVVGIAGVGVVVLAKLKSAIWRKEQPGPIETVSLAITPARARAEVRVRRGSVSLSKTSGGSDALASAAARVFKQMEMGQGLVSNSLPPVRRVNGQVERRDGSETKLSKEPDDPVGGRIEPSQSSQARPWREKEPSVQREEGHGSNQHKWPLAPRPVNVLGRTEVHTGGERVVGPEGLSGLRPVENGRVSGDNPRREPGQTVKQSGLVWREENKPSMRPPTPVKHVESVQGPLENPLPSNPLLPLTTQVDRVAGREVDLGLPIARASEPDEDSVASPSSQNSHALFRTGDHPEVPQPGSSDVPTASASGAVPEGPRLETAMADKTALVLKREEQRKNGEGNRTE